MARYIMTIRSNAVAGREAEFNDWYDRVLLPGMVRSPTLVSGQRFRVAQVALPSGFQQPRHEYLAIYEVESDDIEETVRALWSPENMARIPQSTALDYSTVECEFYTPIATPIRR